MAGPAGQTMSSLINRFELKRGGTTYNPNRERWIAKMHTANSAQTTLHTISGLVTGEIWGIEARVYAAQDANANHFTRDLAVVAYYSGGAAALSTIYSITPTLNSAGASAWAVTFTASSTNVLVRVTGAAATVIHWYLLDLKISRY